MKYHIIAVFAICLILGTGLAAAGTLTVSLQPSLDGKGDIIRAISITKAELLERNVDINVPAAVGTVVSDNMVLFNLSVIKPGDYSIRLNNRSDDIFPTRIDDPTKDISQFVGRTLRVSVIGNLSDPIYIFKTYFNGLGHVNCSDGYQASSDSYIKLSLKTNPQKLEVNGFEIYKTVSNYQIATYKYIDYTPTTPNHPSTSTSTNQPFSKWVFSHGADYNGNDSKCSNCHGNLNTKPASFSDITVNNGFCYRCHYPTIPTIVWLVQEDVCPYHPHATSTSTSIPTTTSIPKPTASLTTTSAPATPGFEALSAIAALLAIVLIKFNKSKNK
jgi:hypothetical protein